jgi:hypothetical protein
MEETPWLGAVAVHREVRWLDAVMFWYVENVNICNSRKRGGARALASQA